MKMVLSPNTVPVKLDQELNSSQAHIGLRKMMYYLKYDKMGLNTLLLLRFRYSCIGSKG
jgi:hypothetical protein